MANTNRNGQTGQSSLTTKQLKRDVRALAKQLNVRENAARESLAKKLGFGSWSEAIATARRNDEEKVAQTLASIPEASRAPEPLAVPTRDDAQEKNQQDRDLDLLGNLIVENDFAWINGMRFARLYYNGEVIGALGEIPADDDDEWAMIDDLAVEYGSDLYEDGEYTFHGDELRKAKRLNAEGTCFLIGDDVKIEFDSADASSDA